MQKIDIFNYSDYRQYMIDHYESEKKRFSSFSYNIWAKKLDLKNNTSIIKIVKGQRNAGPEMIEKLNEYFRFTVKEKEYFSGLVELDKETNSRLQVLIKRDLQKLNFKNKVTFINEDEFSVISSVWCFAFRSLARLGALTDDIPKLSKLLRFKPGTKKIAQSFDALLSSNLLEKNENGYSCLKMNLNTSDDVASEALKQFHEEALDLAKESLRATDPKLREISGLTLTFSTDRLEEAKTMIREFQDQFAAQFGKSEGANHVYQMQTQFFPLTHEINSGVSYENKTVH